MIHPETPQRHKRLDFHELADTKPLRLTTSRLAPLTIGKQVKVKLSIEPDTWQSKLISRALRGLDTERKKEARDFRASRTRQGRHV